jgi:hypothetical protein
MPQLPPENKKKQGYVLIKCLVNTSIDNKPVSMHDMGDIVFRKIVAKLEQLESRVSKIR